jgi:hypothetical protein
LWLADGFIAGVKERRGLGAVASPETLLLSRLGIFEVEHAAELAAIEDETMLHSSDVFVRGYEAARGAGCSGYTKRAANPVFTSCCRVLPE